MSKNDITGDSLTSKIGNKQAFDQNYDRIWGKHPACQPEELPPMSKSEKWLVAVLIVFTFVLIPLIIKGAP